MAVLLPVRTVAISALAHAAVVAAWWTYTPDPPPPPPPAPTVSLLEVELPKPVPAPAASAAMGEAAPVGRPAPRRVAIAATARTTIETAPAPPETTGLTKRALAMRQPGESDRGRIELPTKLEWDPDMPAEAPPVQEEPTGKLKPDGGGTYRSKQGPFTAKVGKDGTVKLKDGKNFWIKLALPSPKDLGKMIGDWYLDDNKPVGMLPPPDPERFEREHMGGAGYGSEKSEDSGGGAGIPILAGGFDISDAFMRGKGQDPYASRKLAFLDATRAERVQIGLRHQSEQLAQASQLMQKNLERLWATVLDPAQRKTELFALWDEVEETGSEELVAAGIQARALIIGWIRAKLPPGAYSADELAALNKRRTSKSEFAPYNP